jgi:hypothetical protein
MRSVSYPDYERYNLTRRTDWRWQRAFDLVAGCQSISAKQDDVWTRRAAGYRKSLARCKTDHQLSQLVTRFPDIHIAHEIFVAGGLRRLELESRLLARESSEEIALKVGVTQEIVDAYEALFFTVRDRIEALAYIVVAAVKKPRSDEPFAPAEERFVRALAYFGGPLVVDAALAWFKMNNGGMSSADSSTLEESLSDRISRLFNVYEQTAWLGRLPDEMLPPVPAESATPHELNEESEMVKPVAELSASKLEDYFDESASDVADRNRLEANDDAPLLTADGFHGPANRVAALAAAASTPKNLGNPGKLGRHIFAAEPCDTAAP